GDEAKALLKEDLTVLPFLEVLVQKQLFQDAVRLLGHALPKREGVWWACLCARKVAPPKPPPEIAAAVEIAEKWVADPSEENRRPAMPAAEAATFGPPAGCCALATFWSGGSLGPPNVPVIPPADHLTGHGVSCAVLLAGVVTEPDKAPKRYAEFLAEGVRVAKGESKWK